MDLNDIGDNTSNLSMEINDTIEEEDQLEPVIPPSSVQFWTYLIFEILSLACTIFLL